MPGYADERLDLAVHARGVLGDDELTQTELTQRQCEARALGVAPIVVGHDRAHANADPGEVRDGAPQERNAVLGALGAKPLDVGQTSAVIDGRVQVLPAALLGRSTRSEALAAARSEPAELLGVDVQERSGTAAFIAAIARSRPGERTTMPQPEPPQDRVNRRAGEPKDPRQPQRALAAASTGARDASLDPQRGTPRRVVWPARADHKRLAALEHEAVPEHVRPARRDAECRRRGPERCASLDARDEQLATERGELGPRVRHERALQLLWFQSPQASSKGSLLVNNLYGQLS